jgi:hypothetical protein
LDSPTQAIQARENLIAALLPIERYLKENLGDWFDRLEEFGTGNLPLRLYLFEKYHDELVTEEDPVGSYHRLKDVYNKIQKLHSLYHYPRLSNSLFDRAQIALDALGENQQHGRGRQQRKSMLHHRRKSFSRQRKSRKSRSRRAHKY